MNERNGKPTGPRQETTETEQRQRDGTEDAIAGRNFVKPAPQDQPDGSSQANGDDGDLSEAV